MGYQDQNQNSGQPQGGYQPPQGGYQPPQGGGYPPPQTPQNDPIRSKAIAAMVLGIIGIVFTFIPVGFLTWVALVLSIVALVMGVQVRKAAPVGSPNRSMATAGFVLGIISVAIWVFAFIIGLAAAACVLGALSMY